MSALRGSAPASPRRWGCRDREPRTLRFPVAPSPALELLKTAIQAAGYPDKVVIGMDVAASEFYRNGKYDLDFKSPDDPARHITGEKLGELYKNFIKNYPGETPPPAVLSLLLGTPALAQHGDWGASAAPKACRNPIPACAPRGPSGL